LSRRATLLDRALDGTDLTVVRVRVRRGAAAQWSGRADDTAEIFEPWAWQHVAGDGDRYDVTFPPGANRPRRGKDTTCDVNTVLELSATGMKLTAGGKSAVGDLDVTLPDAKFPDRHALVDVTNPSGVRDSYQFVASWTQGHYYTRRACELMEAVARLAARLHNRGPLASVIPVPRKDIVTFDPAARFERFSVDVYAQGGFRGLKFKATSVDAVISAPAGQALEGRLFDSNNILVGETIPVADDHVGGSRVPTGLVPQARLSITGLSPGATYSLQLVAGPQSNLLGSLATAGKAKTQVALSPAA
jgi:hypothetical protein